MQHTNLDDLKPLFGKSCLISYPEKHSNRTLTVTALLFDWQELSDADRALFGDELDGHEFMEELEFYRPFGIITKESNFKDALYSQNDGVLLLLPASGAIKISDEGTVGQCADSITEVGFECSEGAV